MGNKTWGTAGRATRETGKKREICRSGQSDRKINWKWI